MQQKRLKCKQLDGKMKSTQKELKINNNNVDNGLNEDFTEIISLGSGKMAPFGRFSRNNRKFCLLCLLLDLVILPLLFAFAFL